MRTSCHSCQWQQTTGNGYLIAMNFSSKTSACTVYRHLRSRSAGVQHLEDE